MSYSDLPDLMKVSEFAKYANVCETTVRRNIRKGNIPAVMVGGTWRIITEQALFGGARKD